MGKVKMQADQSKTTVENPPMNDDDRMYFSMASLGEAHAFPADSRVLKVDPPVELKAGLFYVFYIDPEKETVSVDRVSEKEWWLVSAGKLPGEAVQVHKDMTVTEIVG